MPMLSRSIALATILCAGASLAVADDPGKAPCEMMAQYLRDYAQYHLSQPVDTGQFEFLGRAAHIGYDQDFTPSRKTRVSALTAQSFDSKAAAVQAIQGVTASDGAEEFLGDEGYDDAQPTQLRDLRPYSDHVILSQTQGSMLCDFGVFFRIEGTRLVQSSRPVDDPGVVCWTMGLMAIRVGRNAYPAIWEVGSGPSDLEYSIALLNPEGGAVGDQDGFCRVKVTFRPQLHINSWYPARGADPALLAKLRALLGPLLTSDTEDAYAAHLKALRPVPKGDDPYDDLLSAEDPGAQELLHAIDPTSQMAEIPNVTEESYTFWSSPEVIPVPDPIEIDHHRLLLITGQPTFGWRTWPDLAFAVWEWTGTKVVPVTSGYLAKRATNPEITVE